MRVGAAGSGDRECVGLGLIESEAAAATRQRGSAGERSQACDQQQELTPPRSCASAG